LWQCIIGFVLDEFNGLVLLGRDCLSFSLHSFLEAWLGREAWADNLSYCESGLLVGLHGWYSRLFKPLRLFGYEWLCFCWDGVCVC